MLIILGFISYTCIDVVTLKLVCAYFQMFILLIVRFLTILLTVIYESLSWQPLITYLLISWLIE